MFISEKVTFVTVSDNYYNQIVRMKQRRFQQQIIMATLILYD